MPQLPKWLTEVSWRTIIGAVLLGGIIHILATLAVPFLGSGTAFARLRDTLPANRMVFLPPPAPGKQPLPFLTPDALYAMCRYDVSVDSLAVTPGGPCRCTPRRATISTSCRPSSCAAAR
jgi:uncharacterized membrane protein